MADTGADIEPATLIFHHPKKIQRQNIADGHDDHEQTARGDAEPFIEDAEVGGDESEGDEEFESQEGALREWIEDGD